MSNPEIGYLSLYNTYIFQVQRYELLKIPSIEKLFSFPSWPLCSCVYRRFSWTIFLPRFLYLYDLYISRTYLNSSEKIHIRDGGTIPLWVFRERLKGLFRVSSLFDMWGGYYRSMKTASYYAYVCTSLRCILYVTYCVDVNALNDIINNIFID